MYCFNKLLHVLISLIPLNNNDNFQEFFLVFFSYFFLFVFLVIFLKLKNLVLSARSDVENFQNCSCHQRLHLHTCLCLSGLHKYTNYCDLVLSCIISEQCFQFHSYIFTSTAIGTVLNLHYISNSFIWYYLIIISIQLAINLTCAAPILHYDSSLAIEF